jgi:hypothetical protein
VTKLDHSRYVAEVRKRIRKIYRQPDARGSDKISPGEEMREIVRRRRKTTKSIPNDIALWLVLLDEAIGFWFAVWGNYKEQVEKSPADLSVCLMALAGRVFQDMVCIREMITGGFSVQANVVARSLVESIDVMHLLNSRPDLAERFKTVIDNQASSKFWHEHCSRDKIHKIVKSRWRWFCEEDEAAAAAFHDKREDYLDITGMSVHPGFGASLTTFMDSSASESESIFDIALGSVSHMSKFTMHLILWRVFEYGILWSGPKIGLYRSNKESEVHPFLHHVISKGLSVMASIVKMADESKEGEPLYPEFMTYWPRPTGRA